MLQGDAVSAQLSPHTAMDECCPLASALKKIPDVMGTLLQAFMHDYEFDEPTVADRDWLAAAAKHQSPLQG